MLAPAAAQASAQGRCLSQLSLIGARVFAGYGDYGANTGPITLASVDASDPLGAWTEHLLTDSEQIGVYRELADGRIVTPHIDPHSGDEATSGYGERRLDGIWVDQNVIPHTEHLFDQAQFDGDLWIAGADLDQSTEPVDAGACVWRLPDGETVWARSLIGPRAPLQGDLKRFYVLVIADGKLRVREPLSGASRVWSGTDWIDDGIKPLPYGVEGGPGVRWGSVYVYPSNVPIGADGYALYLFDGMAPVLLTATARGFSVGDDGNLYVLGGHAVYRILPGTTVLTPASADFNPFDLCSLCVLPGSTQAVIGTSSSQLALVDLT